MPIEPLHVVENYEGFNFQLLLKRKVDTSLVILVKSNLATRFLKLFISKLYK